MTQDQIEAGIKRIKRRISELENLDPDTVFEISNSEISGIEAAIESTLNAVFSDDQKAKNRFMDAKNVSIAIPIYMNRKTRSHEVQNGVERGKAISLALLEQAVIYLEEELEFLPKPIGNLAAETNRGKKIAGPKVFVVHGHDTELKLAVARLIEKIGLKPIILHEQSDKGRTIIEKFSDHAEGVGFAVVLLTPDDLGGEKPKKEEDKPDLRARARQNVILELGFFIGKLGRNKVCALHKGDIEIPNDYQGVLFKPVDDADAWQFSLARELKAAGLDVDLNKLF